MFAFILELFQTNCDKIKNIVFNWSLQGTVTLNIPAMDMSLLKELGGKDVYHPFPQTFENFCLTNKHITEYICDKADVLLKCQPLVKAVTQPTKQPSKIQNMDLFVNCPCLIDTGEVSKLKLQVYKLLHEKKDRKFDLIQIPTAANIVVCYICYLFQQLCL